MPEQLQEPKGLPESETSSAPEQPTATEQPLSMGEGRTPLLPSVARAAQQRTLGRSSGLHFKLETTNPSGSYKDRFIAAELTELRRRGIGLCVATSSGNTGAALAAYCARFGFHALVLVNADAPEGKLLQMRAHGARLLRIPGFVTEPNVTEAVFAQLEAMTGKQGRAGLVVSSFRHCPVGMQGVKGIAREIVATLPETAHVFVPAGSGGLFVAISEEMAAIGSPAKVHAVQPEGCATIAGAFARGETTVRPVRSTTRISGLSVPFDIDGSLALRRLRENGGRALAVSDEQVYAAQAELLRREGINCEPAGATALAGYDLALQQGWLTAKEPAVCVVSGHGFKDVAALQQVAEMAPARLVEPSELPELLAEFGA